jgi:hypothetical protein
MSDIRREGTESLVMVSSGFYLVDFLRDYTEFYFKNFIIQMIVSIIITLVIVFIIHLIFYSVNWYNSIRSNEPLSSFHEGLFSPSDDFKKVSKFKLAVLGGIVGIIAVICENLSYGVLINYLILVVISSFIGFFSFPSSHQEVE